MNHSFKTEALVLKRFNTGETDRIVTLLSKDRGKIVCVAKGVRKLKSSNRAILEPGNLAEIFLIKTKSLPILTQSKLIQEANLAKQTLTGMCQLSQILEIFDRLFVEDFIDEETSLLAFAIYQELLSENKKNIKIKLLLEKLIKALGYQDPKETAHRNILDYVAEITEKKMKSFDYLNVG
jgi:DNA repair protein RecO (recombination protein O)